MAVSGLSSLGVRVLWAPETEAGKKPTTGYTTLTRVNAIGGLNIENEQIDSSALEDFVTKYISGRGNVDSNFPVTINLTPETIAEWKKVIADFKALTGGKRIWWEVYHPSMEEAFFVVAEPPKAVPLPDTSQNELWTVEMGLTVNEYVGLDTAIAPTDIEND